ncbi:hypothetical protein FGO68_gene5955 [Halteria grandinella]|uniref:Cyclic nucleotide-binding domain-containing protein n=1 Tax=Halteria grandinella TaxID=5974 RepID=A0A8J8NRL6_HALGN|nr:hypothetical protein FGO68_gene5955 [Halteria grandinella]
MREATIFEYKMNETIYTENDVDTRLHFILSGDVSLVRTNYGKIANLTPSHTLNEDQVLSQPTQSKQRIRSKRSESAFADSEGVVLMSIESDQWVRNTRGVIMQIGMKKNLLYIESCMKRSQFIKKNMLVALRK